MNKYSVIKTSIIKKDIKSSKDGRLYEILEIAYQDFQFTPGQFVMIQKSTNTFDWSYPYMILCATQNGFQITAVPGSSLYGSLPGQMLSLWGANGKGLTFSEPPTLICEPATEFLVTPFSYAYADSSMIFIGRPESAITCSSPRNITFVNSPEEVFDILKSHSCSFIFALNYPALSSIFKHLDTPVKERSFIFASTGIACGIGACRGCYLHSPDIRVGIPVCCEGPYLPSNRIQLPEDAKCFHFFQ